MGEEGLKLIIDLKRENDKLNHEARHKVEFIRPEIMAFAEAMESTMRKHDGIKGDTWKTCDISFLCVKLQEEYTETWTEMDNFLFRSSNCLKEELVDLGNVCMMLWNRKEANK